MERDGEVLLYPGVPDRKSRLRCPLRGSIADDPFGTFASASRLGGLRPVLPLGLLSGGGVPRDSANGARAAVWSAARDSHQQLSLHFRSLTFLSLLAHFSGSPHIRGHFRYRVVLLGAVLEVRQSVDGCHLSWLRRSYLAWICGVADQRPRFYRSSVPTPAILGE